MYMICIPYHVYNVGARNGLGDGRGVEVEVVEVEVKRLSYPVLPCPLLAEMYRACSVG